MRFGGGAGASDMLMTVEMSMVAAPNSVEGCTCYPTSLSWSLLITL